MKIASRRVGAVLLTAALSLSGATLLYAQAPAAPAGDRKSVV